MKNTRTNKNHNTNKKIKTAVIATLTTLTLGFGGVSTAIYLQPSHYQGDTFKNEQSTSISNVSTNNSIHDNSSTTESNNNITTPSSNYTESNSTEVENNYSQETNNNAYHQTPTLTRDIVESYAGCNYQEAIIELKNKYGITGAVTQTVETSDFKDNEIMSASYENNMVYFKIAKHVDTNPYLPVGSEPSEEINSETNEQ